MENKKNGFASGIGFILSAAGSAVGLGNLWGFPYKTAANGGAAFVLIYIICVLFIGFVTMLCEFHIGRRSAANPVTAYKRINKNIGWFGLVGVLIPTFIICYYSVLGGYTVKYTLNSFSGNAGLLGSFSTNVGEVILFTAIFIVLALVIIMGGVKDGIEKMSKVLMPVLFLILLSVAVYSLCLGEGVREGLNFYLNPDFSNIGFSAVLAAMGQAFFSLSLGMGTMISYGSYTGREINIVKSTAMICIFDTFVALLSGLAIFPAVAHFDPSLLENAQGLTLMFSILPEVFNSMGAFGQIISFLFFAMVVIAALTSVVSLVEVATQFIIQRFKSDRKRSALGVVLVCFAVSIPVGMSLGRVAIAGERGISIFGMDLLTFFDEVTNTVLMPVCAFFACLVIGWIIKPKNAMAEIEESGTPLGFLRKIFPIMVRFVTPLLIIVVEIGGVVTKIRAGQWFVVVAAYALLAIAAVAYFIFCKNAETGTNADEELKTAK
ncbi:MAG: sodium-dependent transporter [Ruminococcaceae bacterium]|nr:sodium-dependent transporter [Oscillospiraceae bacterium]